MKNALLLHGTGGHPQIHWFPWLKAQLEQNGYNVWVPQLPLPDTPSMRRYNDLIFGNKDWEFNEESIIVGHSSGAVATLGVLQELPEDVVIDTAILVGAFKNDLGWGALRDFYIPLDFAKIKKQARRFVLLHSEDDPYCPFEHAEYLAKELGGELVVEKHAKHFSTASGGPQFTQLPQVLDILHITTS